MTNVYYVGPTTDPDRYQLAELKSRGGEGELWGGWVRVESQHLPVAVKVFHPSSHTPLAQLHERVRDQAEILRSLEHPNLVKVREAFLGPALHAAGEADPSTSVLYMVMNWAEGENLTTWVERNPNRDPLQCTRVISRIAAAIDELHSGRGIGGVSVLHRDIKPANVVINGDEVRLVDFGLARLASSEFATVAGSPSYIAPEVFAGARPTESADRFGLGATAYFLFCGVAPDHQNPAEMRARLQQVNGIADREGFCEHVMSMMDRDPARRPADVVEWAQSLAVGTVSQTFLRPATPTPRSEQREAARRGRRGIAALVIVLAVLAVVGSAYAFTQGGNDAAAGTTTTTAAPSTTEPPPSTLRPTTSTSTSTTSTTTTTTSTSLPDSPGEISAPVGIQYLADFTAVDVYAYDLESGRGNLSGTAFTRAVMIDPSYDNISYAEYDLGRKYVTLTGSLGLLDDSRSDKAMKVQIYGDGRMLLERDVRLGDSVPFELDVTDVLRLRLQVTDLGTDRFDGGSVIFGDPALDPR